MTSARTNRKRTWTLMKRFILGGVIAAPCFAITPGALGADPPNRRANTSQQSKQRAPQELKQRGRQEQAPKEKQQRQSSQQSAQRRDGRTEDHGQARTEDHRDGRDRGREVIEHRSTRNEFEFHFEIGRGRRVYCPPPPPPRRVVYRPIIVPRVERVVRVERVSYPAHVYTTRDCEYFYGLNSRGWDELRCGSYVAAKRWFRDELDYHPYAPALEVGYSLACGRLGHYAESIHSMRRAVSLDANVLIAVRENCDLRGEAECLLGQYQDLLCRDGRDVDALFMSAALESVLGHWDRADRYIDDAVRFGDCSSSTRDLQCFIEARQRDCSR